MTNALGLLGLCARGGRLISGSSQCELMIRQGEARLVLLDEAASANTKKAFTDACHYHQTPLRMVPPNELGRAIGKPSRMVAAISDPALAKRLLEQMPAAESAAERTIDR